VARSLDLVGQFDGYNESLNEESADKRALQSDWRAIGEAIRDAIKSFGREQATQARPSD
jgi:hypothetical protein